jgi:8-oxo-dGTP pyrophosphatase MutT (NUDIX family)
MNIIRGIKRLWKQPYRGAGVLFWYRDERGRPYVLLGERRAGLHWWSIPGGEMEPVDGDDFVACAGRETHEEMGWPSMAAAISQTPPSHCVRYWLPRYRWTTYMVELEGRPDERLFPNTQARDYWEFLQHGWFPLKLGALPRRSIPMLYPELFKLWLMSLFACAQGKTRA